MRLEWINHAGVVIAGGTVRLACDPWLLGDAFDHGWKLLSPSPVTGETLDVTGIWLSHEHPDHFSVPSLRSIPEARRPAMRLLYRTTRDKKVIAYCRDQGFDVKEVPLGRWLDLAPGFQLMCGAVNDDSWLAVRVDGKTLLNLNDCVFRSEGGLRRVRRLVGEVDVLLTQFSYANWVGNPDDHATKQRAKDAKRDQIEAHIRTFRPRWVVPFASFVWFCHQENRSMNDGVQTVADAERIITAAGAVPIVLYPGDQWSPDDPWDNQPPLQKYEQDRVGKATGPFLASEPVPFEVLAGEAKSYYARIVQANGRLAVGLLERLGFIQPATLFLHDLGPAGTACRLDRRHGLVKDASLGRGDCDIRLGSQGLAYCFQNLWGAATLGVNGRFEEGRPGSSQRFMSQFRLASLNNAGRKFYQVSGDRIRLALRLRLGLEKEV